ncbi:xanthine dehydrogenase family protein subunit M [Thermoflexus sp.]|uniref:FAD binding domain-containing protein n=2 Tax=Thermoflexus sp. TaxID=1969742 RepID=UPI0029916799|nr:xanthine dehydrogenase family protein subunit M [Thermoflexus sp.]MDW8065205.1 xanthine dehydrogenase family protein subunit M [Anaerolineae bacterium]MDW8186127.1 xanthine dehydrogenase family protein subunit M [Anaerolineae bacterium]
MSLEVLHPTTLAEALAMLAAYGEDARPLAGGTALVLLLRHGLIAPRALICLEEVLDLHRIELNPDHIWIGAMVRLQTLARSSPIRACLPVLAMACGEVGNIRIRYQATLGGNLAEADYASDPPIALMVLDAVVRTQKTENSRAIPIAEFFQGFYTTALEPGELIVGIQIPAPPPGARMTYLKFRTRSAEDRPCLGVAALGVFEDGICQDLRVAVGAACERPWRLPEVEQLAIGRSLDERAIRRIAQGYADQIETLSDLRGSADYRRRMIEVHIRRALEEIRNGCGLLSANAGR